MSLYHLRSRILADHPVRLAHTEPLEALVWVVDWPLWVNCMIDK